MYKIANIETGVTLKGIVRNSDGTYIPIASDNTDYQQFKTDIQNGAELLDANAAPITGDALTTFIGTLP
jgi:hypothetical protein